MSVKFGDRVTLARKEKGLSREELAKKIGTSGPIIGRYERGDMMPSVEIATKISDALEVSMDFLVGKSSNNIKDKSMLDRLEKLTKLPSAKQSEIFNVLDAYIRDFKAKQAYS